MAKINKAQQFIIYNPIRPDENIFEWCRRLSQLEGDIKQPESYRKQIYRMIARQEIYLVATAKRKSKPTNYSMSVNPELLNAEVDESAKKMATIKKGDPKPQKFPERQTGQIH